MYVYFQQILATYVSHQNGRHFLMHCKRKEKKKFINIENGNENTSIKIIIFDT